MATYAANLAGYCRCYRCGVLLVNPDDHPGVDLQPLFRVDLPGSYSELAKPLTIDRIIPGCKNGTYRRNNIRPACGGCNSETGGALATPRRKA